MENANRVLISVGVLVVLFIGFYLISSTITRYTGLFVSEDVLDVDKEFIECLEEKDITLYINSEDPSESLRGLQIKDYITSINIFNCLRNNQVCLERGVNEFPWWIIEGQKYYGDVSVDELKEFSGC